MPAARPSRNRCPVDLDIDPGSGLAFLGAARAAGALAAGVSGPSGGAGFCGSCAREEVIIPSMMRDVAIPVKMIFCLYIILLLSILLMNFEAMEQSSSRPIPDGTRALQASLPVFLMG